MKDLSAQLYAAGENGSLLVIAAHPDDEVIGLGARLPRLRAGWFLHVTNGAPANGHDAANHGFTSVAEYAAARRKELEAAWKLAGINTAQSFSLGVGDQEASLQLCETTMRLRKLLAELQPTVVVTHAYEGGHPDHDATAFIVHAALRLWKGPSAQKPMLVEMTSYHQGAKGIETGSFLPDRNCRPVTYMLDEAERSLKARLFGCFHTQQETLRYFSVDCERFRHAPAYEFTKRPHPGKLFYEQFPWGMMGARFTRLAERAERQLGLEGPL